MKQSILAALSIVGLAMSAPAHAQEQDDAAAETMTTGESAELKAFTEIFSSLFEKDETPIDPDMLARGEKVAAAVVPDGSYRKIMGETFQQIVEPMMAGLDEMPLSAVATFAGVPEDEIKIKEGASMGDLMMIIDPHFKERNRAMMNGITDIMIELSDDIEPLIRAGMARAYARRFSAGELDSVVGFFETEAGAKFAGESLSIFASREVMSASMEMMPKFMEKLFGQMEEITKGNGDIPPPRSFDDLSDEELDRLAELMGVPREELTGPMFGSYGIDEAADAAEDFGGMAESAEEAMRDSATPEWSEEDSARVAQLEAEYEAAFERYLDAMEAAGANARKKMQEESE